MVRAIAGGQGRVRTGRIVGPTGTPGVLIGQMIGGSRWNGALTNIAPNPNNLLGAVSGAALWAGALTVSVGATPAFQADFTALSSLPAGVSFSRASNAMVTDSAGKLTYGPNNLITNSTTGLTGGAVTRTATGLSDPDGGSNAIEVTFTGANQDYYWQINNIVSKTIGSVWVKGTASQTIGFIADDAAYTTITLTGAWQQIYLPGTNSNGNRYVDLGTSGALTARVIQVYKPVIAQVTYETTPRTQDQVLNSGSTYYGPRFDYAWNGSAWVAKGLLIEEQRTNLHKSSGDLTTTDWSAGSLTRTTSSTLSPDGVSFMTELLCDGGAHANGASLYNSGVVSYTANTVVTVSRFFKKSNYNYVFLALDSNTSNHWVAAIFDLSTGQLTQTAQGSGSGTFISASLEDVGGGIYRAKLTASHAVPDAFSLIGFAEAATGNTFDAFGNVVLTSKAGTEKFLAWGAQFEVGSFATSYIPTTTAAVTRSQDVLSLAGAADTAAKLSSASVIVEVGELPASVPASGNILASSNHWALIRSSSDNKIWSFAFRGQTTGAVLTWTGINRAGNAYGAASSSVSANGSAPLTGTGSEDWASDGLIYVGGSSGDSINGHIRSLAIYNVRLSDTELQTKSVVGAAF